MSTPPFVRSLAAAAAAVVAGLALLAITFQAASESFRVAQLHPVGAAYVRGLRDSLGLHGTVLTTGNPGSELEPLGAVPISGTIPEKLSSVDTVLVGQHRCVAQGRDVLALVQANVNAGALRLAHSDRLMNVYIKAADLVAPTRDQIAEQPVQNLAASC